MSVESIRKIVTELAGIDNRGAGTPGEKQAAQMVQSEMEALGLETSTQTFRGPKILGHAIVPMLVIALAAASIGFLYPIPGAILIVLCLWALAWVFNPKGVAWTRLVPCGDSFNVIGKQITPGAKRSIVLSAHIDAGQTGLMFHPAAKRLFARLNKNPKSVQGPMFMPVAILGFSLFPLVVRILGGSGALLDGLHFIALGLMTVTLLITLQYMLSPIVPGAIDNASGVAAMLEAAGALAGAPLKESNLYVAATGSEETGMIGMKHFYRAYTDALASPPAYFINFESVGGGKLHAVEQEGELSRVHYPPFLIGFSQFVAHKHGLGDLPTVNLLAATDSVVTADDARQTLCLIALDDHGVPPNYHEMADTADRVDCEVTLASAKLAVAVARELESQGL